MVFKQGHFLAFSQLMFDGKVLRPYLEYCNSTQFNLKDLKEPNLAVSSLLVFYFKVCDVRQDEQAEHVRITVEGTASDRYAADTRYLDSCRKLLVNPKNVRDAQNPKVEIPNEYAIVASLVKMIKFVKDRIWTSAKLHSL